MFRCCFSRCNIGLVVDCCISQSIIVQNCVCVSVFFQSLSSNGHIQDQTFHPSSSASSFFPVSKYSPSRQHSNPQQQQQHQQQQQQLQTINSPGARANSMASFQYQPLQVIDDTLSVIHAKTDTHTHNHLPFPPPHSLGCQ